MVCAKTQLVLPDCDKNICNMLTLEVDFGLTELLLFDILPEGSKNMSTSADSNWHDWHTQNWARNLFSFDINLKMTGCPLPSVVMWGDLDFQSYRSTVVEEQKSISYGTLYALLYSDTEI